MCKAGTDAAVIAVAIAYGVTDDNLIDVVAIDVSTNYQGNNPIALKRMIVAEFAKHGIRMV
jgi:hypothetical protein